MRSLYAARARKKLPKTIRRDAEESLTARIMDLNFTETCFQASAILQACQMKDLESLNSNGPLRFTGDTLEQERREVLEAIVSDMGGNGITLVSWDVNRRLLEHLARPPMNEISKLVQ